MNATEVTKPMRQAVIDAITESQWMSLTVSPDYYQQRSGSGEGQYIRGASCDVSLRIELSEALWEQFTPEVDR